MRIEKSTPQIYDINKEKIIGMSLQYFPDDDQ